MQRSLRDERGFSLIFVALGLVGFVGATALAIDVGMFMTARSQAQNSADAGALAGATALAFDDFADRTASGPAVTNAIAAGVANQVMSADVSLTAADVTFPVDVSGEANMVQVVVRREGDNAVPTLMGRFFGVNRADVRATATAQAAPANAETCVKPFTIPDKWIENQDPGGWTPNSTFDTEDNKGHPLANPDVYIPTGTDGYTGYDMERDKGLRLTLKEAQHGEVAPSFYNPIDLGSTGGSDYRWNIENCNSLVLGFNESLTPENGMMTGPTRQGTQTLVDRDPDAYWDTSNNRVVSSMNPSPRVAIIPVYDPAQWSAEKKTGKSNPVIKVVQYVGFFIEGLQGNAVVGRITPVAGIINRNAGPAPDGAFPRVIRLVR